MASESVTQCEEPYFYTTYKGKRIPRVANCTFIPPKQPVRLTYVDHRDHPYYFVIDDISVVNDKSIHVLLDMDNVTKHRLHSYPVTLGNPVAIAYRHTTGNLYLLGEYVFTCGFVATADHTAPGCRYIVMVKISEHPDQWIVPRDIDLDIFGPADKSFLDFIDKL